MGSTQRQRKVNPRNRNRDRGMPVSPLLKQRRWARISWRYVREYRKGASGDAVLQAVKAQSRHRDSNDRRSRQAEAAMEAMAQAEFGG